MEIEHTKYESIENHYREKWIGFIKETLKEKKKEDLQFVLSEKIHGANFQFYCIEKDQKKLIKVGKRNSMIKQGDGFHSNGVKLVREKYDKKIEALFDLLKETNKNLIQIVVFGELYGGGYPGYKSNQKTIQKHIYYNPEIDFYPFDIEIVTKSNEGTIKRRTITYKEFSPLIEKLGFKVYGKSLFKGTLDECLKFDIKIKSLVPGILGLPEIKDKNIKNLIEGVVIKPYDEELMVGEGEDKRRMILKFKNMDFIEVKPKSKKKQKGNKKNNDPKEVVETIQEINRYITPQRMDNVVSKLGEVTRKDTKKLMDLMQIDVLEEFEKDFPEWKQKLDKKMEKIILKRLTMNVRNEVNQFFKRK